MNKIICPVCRNKDTVLFLKLKFRNIRKAFSLYKCKNCALLFQYPLYPDEVIKNFYRKNYYFFLRDENYEFKRAGMNYVKIFGQNLFEFKRKKIIEIGCGKGYLLYILKNLGCFVKGVEISKEASFYAKDKFKLDVYNGTIEDFVKQSKEKFDIILLIDVIEHIKNPRDFFKSISEISKNRSIVVIDTPNAESKYISYHKEKWSGFNPFHIRIYSLKAIKSLLCDFGFEIFKYLYYGEEKEKNLMKRKIREFLDALNLSYPWDITKKFVKEKIRNPDKTFEELILDLKSGRFKVELKGDSNLLVFARKC